MRILRWALATLLVLAILGGGALWLQRQSRYADASPAAIAAAVSDDSVRVETGRFMTLRPQQVPERMGVIFYPGAYTDLRGYLPTLRPVAAAGYRVILVPMPFDLAILATGRAEQVMADNTDIRRWVIMGHSVGGAAAGVYAHGNPDALAGVVIWDAFPPAFATLADFPKPVWHIHRATPAGLPPASFEKQRGLFPSRSHWVAIAGGIHMNFGSFNSGGYQEDWAPSIDMTEQHRRVTSATLEALADIERFGNPTKTTDE